jgi:hypothetical protein
LKMGSWEQVAPISLKLWSSWSQPPRYLGLQVWATGTSYKQKLWVSIAMVERHLGKGWWVVALAAAGSSVWICWATVTVP